jgi:hypothetical protein
MTSNFRVIHTSVHVGITDGPALSLSLQWQRCSVEVFLLSTSAREMSCRNVFALNLKIISRKVIEGIIRNREVGIQWLYPTVDYIRFYRH